MGYCPPPQNDSSHYLNGGWECQQGMIEYEHLLEPQNDSCCYDNYSCYGWESQNQRDLNDPYFAHQETSSFHRADNKFMQDCSPMPQNDPHCDGFNNYSRFPSVEDEEQSVSEEEEEEVPESSEILMKDEVVEVYEPRMSYPQRLLEVTKEYENSQPTKKLEFVIERYEEEMKKS
ncbi:hypothetical protein AHAS_Ahas15G0199400 [Arachis hypogaea]